VQLLAVLTPLSGWLPVVIIADGQQQQQQQEQQESRSSRSSRKGIRPVHT
jgi:hypothetical protein